MDKGAAHHQKGNKNTKMVQFKIKYRQWTGGGHLVHASDCASEANENLLFLFGFTADELKKSYMRLPDFHDRGLLAENGFADEKALHGHWPKCLLKLKSAQIVSINPQSQNCWLGF